MKFKKIMPYKIKRLIPMLGLAGAAMVMPGCEKTPIQQHMVMPGCEKTPIQQHDTVYIWGAFDWKNIWPADNVRASADSAEVRYVILQNDGNGFTTIYDYELKSDLERLLFEVDAKNRHKVRGNGNIWHLTLTNDEYRKWLENFGFKITDPYYGEPGQTNPNKTIAWNDALKMQQNKSAQKTR